MSQEKWLDDPYVQTWLGKNISDSSKRGYIMRFGEWLDFVKMSPTEQIEKRIKDLQSSDPRVRGFFEDKVVQYKNYLETQYDVKSTIRGYLNAVRSFFSQNRLQLKFGRGELAVRVSRTVLKKKWVPSNSEIKQLYGIANVRDRALLLTLYHSGFSQTDVSALNIEDIANVYELTDHYYIEKLREKTQQLTATCISVEAIHDIKSMLIARGSPEKGALFVSEKGSRLDTRMVNLIISKLAVKVWGDKGKQFKTKNLRQAYNSALLRAKVEPQEIKDVMFGHARAGARGHYAFDETTIRENYKRAFEHISVNHGAQARKDVEEIRQQLSTMQKQMKELIEHKHMLLKIVEGLAKGELVWKNEEKKEG